MDFLAKEIAHAILGLIIMAAIVVFIFVWSPHQLYLAFAYGVAPMQVAIDPYPDDECSFWRIPRGLKDCEHQEIVRTVNREGHPIEPNSPSIDRVIVTWDPKIEKHKH